MKKFHLLPYKTMLTNGLQRSGVFLGIAEETEKVGWGEISPLPKWSKETLEDCLKQFERVQSAIAKIDWTMSNCFQELGQFKLYPALLFALESALLSLISPISKFSVNTSALFMGTPQEILEQADRRYREGYISAKLKVSNLSFEEATKLIFQLKEKFRLRIDVNRAWSTFDSLRFFSQFSLDAFDYVEEPFQNPHDLMEFLHPLAVDESFPQNLSLKQLEQLPTLKAIIYKPTIQGGMCGCVSLHEWTVQKGISLVLSSSFESDLGLAHIASIAHRLSIEAPIGIGTYHYLSEYLCANPLKFSKAMVQIPAHIIPKTASFLPQSKQAIGPLPGNNKESIEFLRL